jgi:hypothetical protein
MTADYRHRLNQPSTLPPNTILSVTGSPYVVAMAASASDRIITLLSAPGVEHRISQELAARFNINSDDYDRAIDAVYNSTKVGGSALHHNLDGSHTFEGAFAALRTAFPHQPAWKTRLESLEHLARDLTTPSGINPFFPPREFSHAKAFFQEVGSDLGVGPAAINDLLNINAAELAGAVLGTATLWYRLSAGERQDCAEQVGRLATTAFFSGNPAALATATAILARMALVDSSDLDHLVSDLAVGLTEAHLVTTLLTCPQWGTLLLVGLSVCAAARFARGLIRGGHQTAAEIEAILVRMFPHYQAYLRRL